MTGHTLVVDGGMTTILRVSMTGAIPRWADPAAGRRPAAGSASPRHMGWLRDPSAGAHATISAPSTSRPTTPSSIAPCPSNGGSPAPPAPSRATIPPMSASTIPASARSCCGWLQARQGRHLDPRHALAERGAAHRRRSQGDGVVHRARREGAGRRPQRRLPAPRRRRQARARCAAQPRRFTGTRVDLMPTFRQVRANSCWPTGPHYDKAVAGFQWPEPVPFNWALDWFDAELAQRRRQPGPLRPLDRRRGDGPRDQAHLRRAVARARTRSPTICASWARRAATISCSSSTTWRRCGRSCWPRMKLGVVVIPATTLLTGEELADRVERGRAGMIVADEDQVAKCAGLPRDGVVFVTTSSSPIDGWRAARRRLQVLGRVHAGRPDQGRRPAAALFHLGHHGQAQAGAAQPSQLSGRARCRRCTGSGCSPATCTQHLLARLGQARLEQLLRAVERRRHGADRQPGAVQRRGAARRARSAARVTTFCAPPTVWRLLDPGGSGGLQGRPARGLRRRRAAQPGGHRAGPRGVGPHHPRRLRPDRDHRHRRQLARPEGQAGRDGPAAAGLPRADPRRRRHAATARARSAST